MASSECGRMEEADDQLVLSVPKTLKPIRKFLAPVGARIGRQKGLHVKV